MAMASGTIAAMAAQMATPWRCGWWWRLVVLLGWALEGNIGNTREHFKSSPCIPCTSASVKSYQLVKVVSGGRAKKFKFGITTTFSIPCIPWEHLKDLTQESARLAILGSTHRSRDI